MPSITEKCIPIYSSINITDHGTMVMVNEDSKNIFGVIWCVAEQIVCK